MFGLFKWNKFSIFCIRSLNNIVINFSYFGIIDVKIILKILKFIRLNQLIVLLFKI